MFWPRGVLFWPAVLAMMSVVLTSCSGWNDHVERKCLSSIFAYCCVLSSVLTCACFLRSPMPWRVQAFFCLFFVFLLTLTARVSILLQYMSYWCIWAQINYSQCIWARMNYYWCIWAQINYCGELPCQCFIAKLFIAWLQPDFRIRFLSENNKKWCWDTFLVWCFTF